jgi:prolyl-tRNA synthetase
MLWSQLFIPTLRENPADAAGATERLLLRAGYARQADSGNWNYLCLAQRSLVKIQNIARDEMNAIGAQELGLGAQEPGNDAREAVAALARGGLRSYRQLPQIWYWTPSHLPMTQDSLSFDAGSEGLADSFQKQREAYRRIFARCGIEAAPVSRAGEALEFAVFSDAGDEEIAHCHQCRYAAGIESAIGYPHPPGHDDPDTESAPEEFSTPDRKTIADVAEFTQLPATSQMKSLVMVADGKPVLALVRGDHQMSRDKLALAMGASEVRPALEEEIVEWFGANPGSLGPVGLKNVRIIADHALEGRRNMIAGANKNDFHLRNVTPGRDFQPEYSDLRRVADGDACAACGAELKVRRVAGLAHLAKPGEKGGEAMKVRVLAANGSEFTPATGAYGLNRERILHAAIEQHNDANGICLPASLAPFRVVITPVNNGDTALREAAGKIYADCLGAGIDALYDDRDERPGVKFKDADLIGVPYRITVGKKLAEGLVELYERRARSSRDVPLDQAAAACL